MSAFSIGRGLIQTENSGAYCDNLLLAILYLQQNTEMPIHMVHSVFCYLVLFFQYFKLIYYIFRTSMKAWNTVNNK